MEKILIVRIQSNYGRELVYPVCDDAKVFAAIAGTKTLSPDAITKIKTLGYTFDVLPKTL